MLSSVFFQQTKFKNIYTTIRNYRNNKFAPEIKLNNIASTLSSKQRLCDYLRGLDAYQANNYLADIFIDKLSTYSAESMSEVKGYLIGKNSLEQISEGFINFCFKNKISMDKQLTLQSFSYHNSLSDKAVKNELKNIKPKQTLNLLGFGLDDGEYEKTIAKYLIDNHIASKVKLFGFDPYAEKNKTDIEFITSEQLITNQGVNFDVITARWVLHHVEMKYRWQDFIRCLDHCNSDAMVLIVEHGFLAGKHNFIDKRLHYLLNATFDIVANIGLRPEYFLSTYPNIGSNFYINYLQPQDFRSFTNLTTKVRFTSSIYDVGPGFPNQTICCMKEKHSQLTLKP